MGAADDLAGVSVMVDLARAILSPASDRLHRPLTLLFNGAEETHQMGAHGFISGHRWGTEVRAVINMEAIGGGGREYVFQCNSLLMARAYGRSPTLQTPN